MTITSDADYEDFHRRVRQAWDEDLTEGMIRNLDECSIYLLNKMRDSLLGSLKPSIVLTMIAEGQVFELQQLAEKLKPRELLIEELADTIAHRFASVKI